MNPFGPLCAWHGQRAFKGRSLVVLLIYVLLLYGIAGIVFTIWMAESSYRLRPNYEELFTILHYFTWGAVGVAALVITPARVATLVGRERERGTLDQLRLTGLSGIQLANGFLAAVLPLPAVAFVAALPLVILGIAGEPGILGVLRAYLGMALLIPFYVLFAAHLGLSVKKAAAATSGALLTVIGLLIASAVCLEEGHEGPKVFALFGPWASGFSSLDTHRTYDPNTFSVWNLHVPGEFLALAVLGVIGILLYVGLVRRLSGERGLLLGRTAAFGFSLALALALGADAGSVERWNGAWSGDRSYAVDMPPEILCVLILVFSLFLAIEVPVGWRDALRSQGSSAASRAFPQHRRLTVRRFLTGPVVIGLGMGLVALEESLLQHGRVATSGLVLAPLVAIAAWVFAALTFQTLAVISSSKPLVYGVGSVGLIVVWFVPLIGAAILDEMGADGLEYFPMTLNPFAGVLFALDDGLSRGTPNVLLAILSFAIFAGGSTALGIVIRKRLAVLEDMAAGMVALPADAYAPPGSLTQRCDQGHAFSGVWDACPHCAELTTSELGAPAPEPDPA